MGDKKIGFITAASLMLFAGSIDGAQVLFDLVTALPIVGWIIGPFITTFFSIWGGITLACWFYYLGIRFVGRLGTAALIEFIPIINAIPAYSAATFLTILAANNETIGSALSFLTPGGPISKTKGSSVEGEKNAAGTTRQAAQPIPTPEEGATPQNTNTQTRSAPVFKSPPPANDNSPQRQSRPNDGLLRTPTQRNAA